MVQRKQLRLTVAWMHSKQRRNNGVKRDAKVLDGSDGIAGDALEVVLMREVQVELDGILLIRVLAVISRVKIVLVLCIIEEKLTQSAVSRRKVRVGMGRDREPDSEGVVHLCMMSLFRPSGTSMIERMKRLKV